MLDGVKGKKIINTANLSVSIIIPVPNQGQDILTIYYTIPHGDPDKEKIFDQILSTFKFLDQNSTGLDKKAIKLVKDLPEVKNWLALFSGPRGTSPSTGGKPIFNIEGRSGEVYTVRAYEEVPPPEQHTATLNVYYVNTTTEKVTKEFGF